MYNCRNYLQIKIIKMLKKSILLFIFAGLLVSSCKVNKNVENSVLDSDLQKASYSLGVTAGSYYLQQGFDSLDLEAFYNGFSNAMNEGELQMTEEECNAFLQEFFTKASAAKADDMKKEGLEFLADNGKREGVITLESGLQYEVITEGTGAIPALTDKVKTHYHGTLLDSTVFDSSVERGEPISFPVNGVIAGWTEALQLMKVGSKWRLFVPYDLAYGERGAGQDIGPYATLIFEIELLEIEE